MKLKNVNIKKIFFLPLFYTTVLIFILGMIYYNSSLNTIRKLQEENGKHIVKLLSGQITGEINYFELLTKNIDYQLLTTGKVVVDHQEQLSSDYLNEIVESFGVDVIYWYNSEGVVLYSSHNQYIGWAAKEGDPIYQFMKSGQEIFVEEIRKSTVANEYYKFVYIRAKDGSFVQVGYNAEYINEQVKTYSFQKVIEELVSREDLILYALITNKDLVTIADTNLDDIGVDWSNNDDFKLVMSGETTAIKNLFPKRDKKVMEIATPLYYNDEIIGVVSVGYSLQKIHDLKVHSLLLFSFLILGIVGSYTFFQFVYILIPARKLSKTIDEININDRKLSMNDLGDHTFDGVYNSIKHMVSRVNEMSVKNRQLLHEIEELAYNDYLTKLPNRTSFIENVKHLIQHNRHFIIAFLDLDGFKEYNDTKGHLFGDELLISISNKLNLLKNENTIVSRFGGDEFLISHVYHNLADMNQFAKQIVQSFGEPILINGEYYTIHASIGVSNYPLNANSIEELIRKADIAMYYAKNEGKNRLKFFEQYMEVNLNNNNFILNTLKKAIKNDGFKLLYQPLIDIKTGYIIGFEGLVRLIDRNISPSVFIPIAERGGLINDLGRLVIEKAIFQLAEWKKKGLELKPIHINISAVQINDSGLIAYINELLLHYHIDSNYLGIEITESAVIENDESAIKFLKELSEMGIETSLDDFGSGHTSLNYLTKFYVKNIKIDKKLTDLYLNASGVKIINAILDLANLLGFNTIVEGIETNEQLELLKTTKSKIAQGFYFFKPIDSEQVLEIYHKKFLI